MSWPEDADGDVLRRMERSGFDFQRVVEIDFNVDFDDWPPDAETLAAIAGAYPEAPMQVFEEDEYVQIRLKSRVSYDLVMSVQSKLTAAVEAFGGECDSWGVHQEPG